MIGGAGGVGKISWARGGGRLHVSCVPMCEKKTMRKGTLPSWAVRSAVII